MQSAALEWLRNTHRFTPEHSTDDGAQADGTMRLHGTRAASTAPMRWLFAALWSIPLGAVLAMANLPSVESAILANLQRIGYVVAGLGMACIAAAAISSRRNRRRVLVELRSKWKRAATPASMVNLHADARGAEAWVIAVAPFDSETLGYARERGVRCFVYGRDGFRDALPGSSPRSPSGTPQPAAPQSGH